MIIILDFDLMTTMTPEIINNPYIGTNLGLDPFQPYWCPLVAIFDFAGSPALQAVSKCPRHR